MKRINITVLALTISISLSIISCSSSQNTTMIDREHNAQTSLDYKGTYKGTLPCADCPGIETTIVIDDDYITDTYIYLERNQGKPTVEKMKYSWSKTNPNMIITDKNTYFLVQENKIVIVGSNGKEIGDSLKEYFKLKKVL